MGVDSALVIARLDDSDDEEDAVTRARRRKEEQMAEKQRIEDEKKRKEEEERNKIPVTLKEHETSAKRAYGEGDFTKAKKYYQATLDTFDQPASDKARITSNVAQCEMKLEKWVDAYHTSQKAIEYDETNLI